MWYYAYQAEQNLKTLSQGYDIEDGKLKSSDLRSKYQGDVLENKSLEFRNLKTEEQKDTLLSSLEGGGNKLLKKKDDAAKNTMAVHLVRYMLKNLDKIGKKEEWFNRTEYHSFKYFIELPVKRKEKYHNALVKYHDEEMKKHKRPPTKPIKRQFLDSSPTAFGGRPDFNNPEKWEKI